MQNAVQSNNVKQNHESYNLQALNETINDLNIRISEDPDPFLVEVVSKLEVIQRNQQSFLVQKVVRAEHIIKGGFKGFGES